MKNIIIVSLALLTFACATPQKNKTSIKHYSSAAVKSLNLPFSEAVQLGDIVYLSGQIGFDTNTGKMVKGGIKAEAKQAMENMQGTLSAMGYSMDNIFKCIVMLADMKEWNDFNQVYVQYFSQPFPARSAFGSSGLAFNGRLEIECMAFVGE